MMRPSKAAKWPAVPRPKGWTRVSRYDGVGRGRSWGGAFTWRVIFFGAVKACPAEGRKASVKTEIFLSVGKLTFVVSRDRFDPRLLISTEPAPPCQHRLENEAARRVVRGTHTTSVTSDSVVTATGLRKGSEDALRVRRVGLGNQSVHPRSAVAREGRCRGVARRDQHLILLQRLGVRRGSKFGNTGNRCPVRRKPGDFQWSPTHAS